MTAVKPSASKLTTDLSQHIVGTVSTETEQATGFTAAVVLHCILNFVMCTLKTNTQHSLMLWFCWFVVWRGERGSFCRPGGRQGQLLETGNDKKKQQQTTKKPIHCQAWSWGAGGGASWVTVLNVFINAQNVFSL